METLKEAAMAYKPKETLNIADLKEVPLNVPLEDKVINEGQPNEFVIIVAVIDEKEYRVPKTVLKSVQALLRDERTKNMKSFSVLKTGTTKDDTRYQVVPRGV